MFETLRSTWYGVYIYKWRCCSISVSYQRLYNDNTKCQVVTSYTEYAESALLHNLNNPKRQVSLKSSVLRSMGQKQGTFGDYAVYQSPISLYDEKGMIYTSFNIELISFTPNSLSLSRSIPRSTVKKCYHSYIILWIFYVANC